MLTFNGWNCQQLLVNVVCRGGKAKSEGGSRKEIQQEGKHFQANINCWSISKDCNLFSLEILTCGGRDIDLTKI